MGFSSFLKRPEVKAKLKPLRPMLPRKIPAALRAEPQSDHHSLVGSAFDYLLRFELQRRAPHAVTEPWPAEQAPDYIWTETETGGGGAWLDWLDYDNPVHARSRQMKIAKRARKIVEDAKAAVAAYLKLESPNRAKRAALAAHAIRLAKLELVLRRNSLLDPRFDEADAEDVKDLLSMLAVAPFDALLHDKVLRLSPTLSEMGGTADLIIGDMLVDFKATQRGEMQVDHLDQLLGYYLLARRQLQVDPMFPEINRLALYFCRHGYLWVKDAITWTNNPQFSEVEEWFATHFNLGVSV